MSADTDQEVRISVELDGGKIVVRFGASVDWISLTPGDALTLATALRDYVLLAQLDARAGAAERADAS